MRQVVSNVLVMALLGLGVASLADQSGAGASAKHGDYTFTEEGYLRVKLVSVKRTGNKVTVTLTYENLTNEDKRMLIYSGGAGGKDTMLIDSEGKKWELLKPSKGGAEGPYDKIFIAGVPVQVPISFYLETGNLEVESFTLKNWIHILKAPGGTAKPRWADVTMKIPGDYGQ